jgi:hypothetical protein
MRLEARNDFNDFNDLNGFNDLNHPNGLNDPNEWLTADR